MTRARELGKLANKNSLTADNTNNFVGIGSTQPDARLDVDGTVLVGTAITLGGASGIVSATSFYGDGSNLDGVASAGLGTALAETQPGSVIYYTDSVLGIGSTVVVDPPTSTNVAYTQYSEISVDENVDFIVAEGDDFVPDILGIGTVGITTLTGIGGRIRAGTFTNKAGTGAPQLTFGAEIPVGYGLTGAGGINVGGAATIGGNLNVGGVLTYEDVTNIDSLGIITARGGVEFGASGVGGTVTATGNATFTGVVTATSFVGSGANLTGLPAGGVEIESGGSSLGAGVTILNFQSGATVTASGAGSTITISAGITTTAVSPTANAIHILGIGTAQHHTLTLSAGFSTITVAGGSVGDSHSVVLIQPSSGICTVGLSTFFQFPSGATPVFSQGSSKVDLISFVVKHVGVGGTELLTSAGLNYS
tara:strand:+ start:323 stop:1588 length:1266 start_codon:yes stop_codon:yes gene_type:complete